MEGCPEGISLPDINWGQPLQSRGGGDPPDAVLSRVPESLVPGTDQDTPQMLHHLE